MPSTTANPEPAPAAVDPDQQYKDELTKFWDERKAQRQSVHIAAYEARKAELDTSQPAPEPSADPYAGMGGDLAKALKSLERHRRELAKREASDEPAPEAPPPAKPAAAPIGAKKDKIICFPVIPAATKAIVNELARSSLFAAIQGKERQLVKDMRVEAIGESEILFTGEQFNQDDHDTLMQLASVAMLRPVGEYVTVSGHSLLKALGRGTSGKEHKQLDAEINRIIEGTIKVKSKGFNYIGHLIHDAVKHEISGQWVYRMNDTLQPLYSPKSYTLIDWQERKRLRGNALARWLHLWLSTHADSYPLKVETLRRLSGSKAKELRKFRQMLKSALVVLQTEGHITAWRIDENDLVHVERPPQRRRLANKTP